MNRNIVYLSDFSNPASRQAYRRGFPDDADLRQRVEQGEQCGGCSYFAPLNGDWGICCHPSSPHQTETVFKHFGCREYKGEGWGAHSFGSDEPHSDNH